MRWIRKIVIGGLLSWAWRNRQSISRRGQELAGRRSPDRRR